ncbi:hypothetical protein [Microbacterium testaceum]|uniref:hypothetical protein n=1 Tax=Microbacterium testaceum TaxID=2033 RepID=UPI0025B11F85|nr:hypothetical protein [Microbacterium testaceum]WJS91141.1 hypothetical protein NYQ11_00895 [Microbacterium testaceum]
MAQRYYYTMDGSSMEFGSDFRGPRDQVAHLLGLLRPGERSTFILGAIPEGIHFAHHIHEGEKSRYLQCAGTSDAMTIEWHKIDDDGQDRHYIVGHGGDHSGEPSVDIPFFDGTRKATVYPDEVFALDEATDIFFHYYETGEIPSAYELRWYDLTWPKPQP